MGCCTVLQVTIGTAERGVEFSELTAYPADKLLADPENVTYDALQFEKGVVDTFFNIEVGALLRIHRCAGLLASYLLLHNLGFQVVLCWGCQRVHCCCKHSCAKCNLVLAWAILKVKLSISTLVNNSKLQNACSDHHLFILDNVSDT